MMLNVSLRKIEKNNQGVLLSSSQNYAKMNKMSEGFILSLIVTLPRIFLKDVRQFLFSQRSKVRMFPKVGL